MILITRDTTLVPSLKMALFETTRNTADIEIVT
jgi:hypothetical protein